jgi:F0F1-type ATP synthase membrane subunit b/b'
MKRFLYQPILDAIDAREKRIAAELAGAAAKQAEAEQAREDLRHKDAAFDQQRATLLRQAVDAAQEERQRLLEEARQAADTLSAKRRQALAQEQQHLSDELARRTRDEVFAIVRKALADLAGIGLEARTCSVSATSGARSCANSMPRATGWWRLPMRRAPSTLAMAWGPWPSPNTSTPAGVSPIGLAPQRSQRC